MPADIDHAKIVQTLTETHEKRLFDILKQLEERVADLAMSAPTKDGDLFDLKWAIDARTDLSQIMRDTYLTEVDSQVREYDQIVDSFETMLNEYTDYTGLDPEVVSQLKRVSFQGFEDIATTFTNDLAEELYQSTLSGREMSESVRNLRQKINGVYIASDDAEIERLVELAQAGDEGAVRELHQKYAADRAGNNMRRYARQMVFDSAMQFDAAINVSAGKDIGAENWKYYGSVITDTREHCAKHAGKTMTEEYIRETWAKTNWKGKADGDPFIVRGGYNCRHHFRPSFDEVTLDATEEPPKKADKPKKVATKAASVKRMTALTSKNYLDPRYLRSLNGLPVTRFRPDAKKRSETPQGWMKNNEGKVTLPSGINAEGAQIIADVFEEVDGLASTYNVPKLRAVSGMGKGKHIASMGDGVLAVNGKFYSKWGTQSRYTKEEVTKQLADADRSLELDAAELTSLKDRYMNASRDDRRELAQQYNKGVDAYNRKVRKSNELREIKNAFDKPVSTWTPEQGTEDGKPYNIEGYFENPVDKGRAVVFHEYGHHVHQQYGVTDEIELNTPPIERWMDTWKEADFYNSKYAKTSKQEHFAESFAAYRMGRRDLVEPKMLELLDAFEAKDYAKVDAIIGR